MGRGLRLPAFSPKGECDVRLYSTAGGSVNIGDERAKKLLESSNWFTKDQLPSKKGSETAADAPNDEPQGDDPTEPVEEVPEASQPQEQATASAAVVRAWAKKNDIQVPAKGRVPEVVYEQYAEAHKN